MEKEKAKIIFTDSNINYVFWTNERMIAIGFYLFYLVYGFIHGFIMGEKGSFSQWGSDPLVNVFFPYAISMLFTLGMVFYSRDGDMEKLGMPRFLFRLIAWGCMLAPLVLIVFGK
jgi:hypothetical protein